MTNALDDTQIDRIFSQMFSYAEGRRKNFINKNKSFVHYTSAQNAINIIRNKEIWLRNALTMNDRLETIHGYSCLKSAVESDIGRFLFTKIEKKIPDCIPILSDFFEDNFLATKYQSYVTCMSEHDNENLYHGALGKLSMWRAYAPRNGVGIVLNSNPFFGSASPHGLFTTPILYASPQQFLTEFSQMAQNIVNILQEISVEHYDLFQHFLILALKSAIVSTKHPIFSEEEEWRVVGWPSDLRKDRVELVSENISGIPQMIYKIPLRNYPEENFQGLDIPSFIEKIIIGPSDFPYEIQEAIAHELSRQGVINPNERLIISDIPLR